MYYIVGLGNPGEEYKRSRHNAGRVIAEGLDLGKKAQVILPDTYMNKSGVSLKKIVNSAKKAGKMIVVHDDIDMPLGKFKIVFGQGSGGHRGVESVNRAVKTKNYIRVKIGISPKTPSGKIRKPKGDKNVIDFVIKPFKTSELVIFKKMAKRAREAIGVIVSEGFARAMNEYN